jgi:hypothetical protein
MGDYNFVNMSFDTTRDAQGVGRRDGRKERRAPRTELQKRARTNVTVGRSRGHGSRSGETGV